MSLIREIDGLDILEGLQRYRNNTDVYLEVLHLYTTGIRSYMNDIKTFDEKNLLDYKIRVHGIKGASLDIFADRIANEASALEKAASSGDIDYITKNNPIFLEYADSFISDIEQMLSCNFPLGANKRGNTDE